MKQNKIRQEIRVINAQNALGAGRTAAVVALARKYNLSTSTEGILKCINMFGSFNTDYWNA